MSQPARYHLRLSAQKGGSIPVNLQDLWEYRELVGFLAWREVSSRYRQAALGATWAIIQPLLTMAIFSLIFGRLAKVPSDGVPYPIFSFAALLPWQYCQSATVAASKSLVTNTSLITKVYFPRLVIPLSYVLPALLDLAVSLVVFFFMMLFYGIQPTWRLLCMPAFVLLAFCTAFGVGLWSSALSVQYRDVRHVIPFLTQFWMFASPVAYSSSLIPESWRSLFALNPMALVIDGFRWSALGIKSPLGMASAGSTLIALLLLLSGALYFRKMERDFADVI